MKTLLIGYYGHCNLGDERLKQLSEEWILLCDPEGSITTQWRRFFSVDRLVFGGGGLFQNVTSFRSLCWYCFWAFLAVFFRKPYGLLGQGIGPVTGLFSNWLLDFVLWHSAFVTVRDNASKQRVSKVRAVSCSPDMTFFSDVVDGYEEEGKLGLNLRPFLELDRLGNESRSLLYETADDFLSFSPEDSALANDIACHDMAPYFLGDTAFPDRFSGLVAMRFHACVWAALNGIPFLALVYDDKVAYLAERLGQPVLDLRLDVSVTDVESMLMSFLKNKKELRDVLTQQVEALRSEKNNHLIALKEFYDS